MSADSLTLISTEPEPAAAPATMSGRVRRLALWYEEHRRPGWVLAALALVLYGPTLLVPFVVDDYRNLRVMEAYRLGERPRLDLYRFFSADGNGAAQRAAGLTPWWVSDGLRFEYVRPLAEWSLYLDYLIWGGRAAGHRLAAVGLFVAAVWLVLALMRAVQPDEARARWAALLFAVASCHVVTVVFVAARCDLLVTVLSVAALLAAVRFVRGGPVWWLPAVAILYLAALLSKETAAALWVAVPALCLAAAARRRAPAAGRTVVVTATMLVVACGWYAWYRAQQTEINVACLLDPLARPGEYMLEAPRRMISALATWLIPFNPALLLYDGSRSWFADVLLLVGAAALLAAAGWLGPRLRHDPAARAAAFWPLPFVALLVCTPPDDRLMMLPMVGLAYLGAAWLRLPSEGRRLVRPLPALLFLAVPLVIGRATSAGIFFVERQARMELRAVHDDTRSTAVAPRPASADQEGADDGRPCVFFVNTGQLFSAIWAQDRARYFLGDEAPHVAFLCDLPVVEAEPIDERRLRLKSVGQPFLTTLLGGFGLPRGARVERGQRFASREFEVRAVDVKDGRPTTLEITFREPLNHRRYYFYHLNGFGLPRRWRPEPGDARRFGLAQPSGGLDVSEAAAPAGREQRF